MAQQQRISHYEILERIVAAKGNIQSELVLTLMKQSAPVIAERMIDRAQGTGAAAQRAAEYIQDRVLGSGDQLHEGQETIDMIALRIRRRLGK